MENLPHYNEAATMLKGTVYCNIVDDNEKLKNMDIDRRWKEDNRIPTWTFGMQNFGFDQNFIHNGLIINDTDDRVQKILGETDEDIHVIIGQRNIRENGNWFKLN
jgi:predicted nuclease of restriction endonuclease-like (RecB) superfamily